MASDPRIHNVVSNPRIATGLTAEQQQWVDDVFGNSDDEDTIIPNQNLNEYNGFASDPNWQYFLSTIKTRDLYENRMIHFFDFKAEHVDKFQFIPLKDVITEYFFVMRDAKKADGSREYSGSVFKSWFAIFAKFYESIGLGVLKNVRYYLIS